MLKRLRSGVRRWVHGRIQAEVDEMAAVVGVPVEHVRGGSHDSFTHAYASARLTLRWGNFVAARLGDVNELFGSLAAGETLDAAMDQHNNAVGREIGARLRSEGRTSKREVAEAVRRALVEGRLRELDQDGTGKPMLVPSGGRRAPAVP